MMESYKKILSSTESSLIKILYKNMVWNTCATFLNNIHFLTNRVVNDIFILNFMLEIVLNKRKFWEPLNSV